MSAKHADPEYRKNARIVRQQVAKKRRGGEDVTCWRCGRPLDPEAGYDVGHINPAGGHALSNLSPEHRTKAMGCRGNRAAGGQLGASMTNARRKPAGTSSGMLTW